LSIPYTCVCLPLCDLKVGNLHSRRYILVFMKSELVSLKVLERVLMQIQAVVDLTPFNTHSTMTRLPPFQFTDFSQAIILRYYQNYLIKQVKLKQIRILCICQLNLLV
jgi:hypothetical protein